MRALTLNVEIDEMKKTLNSLILNNSLTDELVVYYSQKLDNLIVKYERNKLLITKRAV